MNYWLSPSGRVINCTLGGHTEKAIDLVFEKYETEAINEGVIDEIGLNTSADVIGFIERRGWIRYQDWFHKDGEWIIHNRRPTEKQIEMMFELTGYYYKANE